MQYEEKDVIVVGSNTHKQFAIGTPDEHFEILNGEVICCLSKDINLNSKPELCRILNHVQNEYDVDLSFIQFQ